MTPDDLIAAVRAALDETERIAFSANVKQDDPNWYVSEVLATGGRHFTVRSVRDMRPIARVERLDGDDDEPAAILDGAAVAAHIAANDPAAVLRRVAADRRILAEHQPIDWGDELYCDNCGDSLQVRWPCPTVRALADGLGIDLEETTP